MKNYFSIPLVLCFFVVNIYSQTTEILDVNFEQALIDLNIDSDNTINGTVLTSDISGITYLDVSSKSISDLTGIQDFISLTGLYCHSNQLTSLNITNNTALTFLQCYNNLLTSIDVTQNIALTFLNFNGSQLSSIDLSQNTLLTSLGLTGNLLTSLDISENTALTYIQCQGNQLTTLDVSNNIALYHLKCFWNQLSSLDISNNTALGKLNCSSNQIPELNTSQNTLLTELTCSNNPLLTTLDITNNTILTDLNCSDNPLLATLDITNNTILTTLDCYNNSLLTSLDLSNNTALEQFNGPLTPFTSLDFSNNTSLTMLNCSYNPLLTSLNVKNGNNLSITSFDARNNLLLECIQVDDETAANAGEAPYTNWLKDATTTYLEDCASLSLNDVFLATSISLYPNPVSNILFIDSKIQLKKVEFFSLLGQKVKELNSNFNSIPTNDLSNGIYIVVLESENGIITKKFIKK